MNWRHSLILMKHFTMLLFGLLIQPVAYSLEFTLCCKQYAPHIHQFSPCLGSSCDTYLRSRSIDHKNYQLCSNTLQLEAQEVNFLEITQDFRTDHKFSYSFPSKNYAISKLGEGFYQFLCFLCFHCNSSWNSFTVMSLLLVQGNILSLPTSISSQMVSQHYFRQQVLYCDLVSRPQATKHCACI